MTSSLQESKTTDPLLDREVPMGVVGPLGLAFNMICNIVGGGILVLPSAARYASCVVSAILIVVFGVFSFVPAVMIVRLAEHHQRFSFGTLIQRVYSNTAARIFDVVLAGYTGGMLIAYGRAICDTMPDVAEKLFHLHGAPAQAWLWLLVCSVFFVVLGAQRALAELKVTSFVGIATIMYVCVIIYLRFFTGRTGDGGVQIAPDADVFLMSSGLLRAIPIITVSYSCHFNIPFFYRELSNRTLPRMTKVLYIVFSAVGLLYASVSVLGYLTCGNEVLDSAGGNIVRCYLSGDTVVNVGRLLLAVHFVMVFPLVSIACRNSLNNLIFATPNKPMKVYALESVCIVCIACTAAYFIPAIGDVVEIVGALFGTQIVMVVPSALYVATFAPRGTWAAKLFNPSFCTTDALTPAEHVDGIELVPAGWWRNPLLICGLIMIPVGIVSSILALTLNIVGMASGHA